MIAAKCRHKCVFWKRKLGKYVNSVCSTHRVWGWGGLRASLDALEERKNSSACWELKHDSLFSNPFSSHITDYTTLSPISKHKLEKVLLQDRKRKCILQGNVKFVLYMKDPGGGQFFHPHPDWPWGPPSLLSNGYRVSLPEVKRLGYAVDGSPPSSVAVKESVELYHCSHSGPSWPVLGWTLPYLYNRTWL